MDNATRRAIGAMIDPMRRKVSMMVARAVLRLVDDGKSRQILQAEILKDELRDGIERVQNYGLTSHPKPGADVLVVSVSGSREQSVAIVVDDRRYRLNLQEGEVALYDDLGNKIVLQRDMILVEAVQHLEATAPTTRIVSDVTIDGTLTVNGDVETTGSITNNGVRVDSTHTHGGVQTGGGSTGVPN